MNSFANAVVNQESRTTNGMKARKSTANPCVDLFYKIGASRGKNIIPEFVAAYAVNKELALRIAQWARDVRGGAGERQIYRDILQYLEANDPHAAVSLALKTPEIGRFDDLFSFVGELKDVGFEIVRQAIEGGNQLAAKWTPRKGSVANQFREYLGWSPKFYRKTLVNLTNVVEQKMCSNNWDIIEFSKVPSLAAARYKAAFHRHTQKYAEYVAKLVKGDDPTVKVNASAVYPYDVIKGVISHFGDRHLSDTERNLIIKQWEALPNFMNDTKVLPMVDVSGSMYCSAGKSQGTTCVEVATSLGIYCADKNSGVFKDLVLTFSESPQLMKLYGNVVQKLIQLNQADWGMSTNLHAAFTKVLEVARKNNVPAEEMPEMVLIFSDMQFNSCTRFDDSAHEMIARKYEDYGYKLPKIVFWNLNSYDNTPVEATTSGVALVSGFSPSVMKAVLSGNLEDFSPESIMMQTVMVDRYAI